LYENWKIFTNVSSGFRAPSLYQLYSEYGNKDLNPEESTSVEAGVQYAGQKFSSRVVAFSRKIKDVFTFYTDPTTFAGKYINDDLQKDHGAEAEVSYRTNKLNLSANYTYVTGKITSDNGAGKDSTFFNLYRRPENTFNVNLGYYIVPAFYVQASAHVVSKFFEPVYGKAPLEMEGYHTINFYTEYKLQKKVRLFADFRNVTDEKYFEARGFNSKRFNVDAGVSVTL
jgi:vitamin B12 transporter